MPGYYRRPQPAQAIGFNSSLRLCLNTPPPRQQGPVRLVWKAEMCPKMDLRPIARMGLTLGRGWV